MKPTGPYPNVQSMNSSVPTRRRRLAAGCVDTAACWAWAGWQTAICVVQGSEFLFERGLRIWTFERESAFAPSIDVDALLSFLLLIYPFPVWAALQLSASLLSRATIGKLLCKLRVVDRGAGSAHIAALRRELVRLAAFAMVPLLYLAQHSLSGFGPIVRGAVLLCIPLPAVALAIRSIVDFHRLGIDPERASWLDTVTRSRVVLRLPDSPRSSDSCPDAAASLHQGRSGPHPCPRRARAPIIAGPSPARL